MKSIRYVIVILTLLLSFNAFTQSAAINNDIKLVLEESEWPVCIDPTDVSIASDAHESKVSWNNQSTQGNYYFEVGVFEDAKEYPSTVFETKTNFLNLENSYFQNRENTTVKIRRICIDKQFNKYTSKWVEALSFAPCTPGSISGTSTICGNTLSPTIANATSASGGVGYIWQSRTGTCSAVCCASTSGWTTISGATSQDYIPGVLSQTTTYRRGYNCGSPATPSYSYSNCITITVTTPTITPGTISSNTSAICPGLTATITGTLASSTSGTIQYQWQSRPNASSAYTNITSATSQNYTTSALTASTQFRRLAKTSTCTTWSPSNEISININAAPTASISSTSNSVCLGSSMSMTASGGGSYSWSNGLGSASTATVTPSSTTTYTVTVTGSNGCTSTAQKTITVNTIPTASITASNNNNAVCFTNSITLTAAGGGTYLWSAGLVTTSSISVTPSATTTYTVTVTAANSTCTSSSQITITVNPNPTPSITSSNGSNPVCAGTAVSMTASGGVSYVWSNGNTGAFNSVNPTYSMSYTVTVTGSNGCTAMGVKDITVNPLPIAQITGESNICPNQTKSLVASGGTSYEWSTGSSNATIQINNEGIYTVTVTNNNGCTSSASKEVTLNNSCCQFGFEYIVNTSPNIGSCPFTYKLFGSFSITNPVPGAKVKIKETNSNLFVEKTLVAGTYNYTFEINNIPYNGGSYTVEFTIDTYCGSVPPTTTYNHSFSAPSPASVSGPNNICENTTGVLSVVNPPSNATYLWSTGETTQSITLSANSSSNYNGSTAYSVAVTSTSGCVIQLSKEVAFIKNPEVSIVGSQNICVGQSTTMTASTNANTPTYAWSNNVNTSSNTVSPTQTTTYLVTVTNTSGCQNTKDYEISVTTCTSTCSLSSINVTPSTCNPTTNEYSISGSIMVLYPIAGQSFDVIEVESNKKVTVTMSAGNNGPYNFQITGLLAGVGTHHVNAVSSSCGSISQSYACPASCSNNCSSILDVATTSCNPATNTFSATAQIMLVNPPLTPQQLTLTLLKDNVIQNTTNITTILNQANYSFTFANLASNGAEYKIELSGICGAQQKTFTSQSCLVTCGITAVAGQCDPSSNTFTLNGSINISNPNEGQSLTIYENTTQLSTVIVQVNGQNNYNYSISNVPANGSLSSVTVNTGACGTIGADYTQAADCMPSYCNIWQLSGVPTACEQGLFKIQGTLIVNNPTDGEIITINDNIPGKSCQVTLTSATSYNFIITTIPADGLNHTLSINHPVCGLKTSTYKAPSSCSNLPSYACGTGTYTVPSVGNSAGLSSAVAGDIFTVAGIAFQLTEVSGSNGTFSGKGKMAHPFGSKPLKVEFYGIGVNADKNVTSGNVLGVREPLGPNFAIPTDTLNIGGDICVENTAVESEDEDGFDKLNGLNERGFKKDSLFYPDSSRYDRLGYDYAGNYKDGSPYDQFGCNVKGLTSDGKECKRDSSLVALRDSLINSVNPTTIELVIDDLLDKVLDSLSKYNCTSIFNEINALILNVPSQREIIAGKADTYINEGLSTHFISELKKRINSSNITSNVLNLEAKHIALYKCDLFRNKFKEVQTKINSKSKQEILAYCRQQLNNLSKEELQKLKDPIKLKEWILVQINNFLDPENSINFLDQKFEFPTYKRNSNEDIIIPRNQQSSAYYSLATNGINLLSSSKVKKGEEEKWLFDQNFEYIKGVSRGLYLHQLHLDRQNGNSVMADDTSTILLPIPLIRNIDENNYNIYLDNISISSTGAKLDAFFIYEDPNSSKKLVMSAKNLNWGTSGLIGETKLELKSTVELRLSNSAMLILKPVPVSGQGGCYASWDCSGFKELAIDADIELCRNLITPVDPATMLVSTDPNERYKFGVKLVTTKWSDIYFELNGGQAKPFVITGYEDLKWTIINLAVDYSDYVSPKNVKLLGQYHSPHVTTFSPPQTNGQFLPSWRGVYIGKISLTLPNSFSSSSTQQISAGGENIVIDDTGFTGKAFGSNVVNIETGSLGGWPFSLDTISIIACQNHVIGGGLVGKIKVPVFQNPMRYTAMMHPDNSFQFKINPTGDEKMDMLLADVTLNSNSKIEVTIKGSDVTAIAELNGSLNIGTFGTSSIGISIPKVEFTEFKVGNKKPYFEAGKWTVDSLNAKLLGFEMNISNIEPIEDKVEQEYGLSFKVGVKFPVNLAAYGGLEVLGTLAFDDHGRQQWKYKKTKVNTLGINAEFAAGRVTGYLETFENKPLYGSGFQGLVSMELKKLGKFSAMALFGKTSADLKYFFIDASAQLTKGIPAGPIEINGFVGGVSYAMNVNAIENFNGLNPNVLPKVGQSFSGNEYIPDAGKGLGLRAGVTVALVTSKSAFNGQAVFEMLFNKSNANGEGGGLASLTFDGKGQFMSLSQISGATKQDTTSKPSGISGSVSAHLRLKMDFNADVFTGRLSTYLNMGIFKGAGPGGLMVTANLHADKQKWYIYVGTPNQRCGIVADFGIIKAKLDAYFDIGSVVPNMPPLPPEVVAIATQIKQNPTFRSNGRGFVLGASFSVDASFNAYIASASIKAKIGFDLMVRHFENAKCGGNDVGINGWYAMGQMYAFLEGEVKIFGINIVKAGIAAVLQAQLPNPTFAQATFGMKIKTIFGSKHINASFAIGNRCVIVEDPNAPLGMKVIASISPANNGRDIPVDIEPQVAFNASMDTTYTMGSDVYKTALKKVSLVSLKNGYVYNTNYKFDKDKVNLEIKPDNLLFGKDSVKLVVLVQVAKNGGNVVTEKDSVIFTIGDTYSVIPKSNIAYSYPSDGMHNFHRNEYAERKGFIQLKAGMPEIFYNVPDGQEIKVRITSKAGDVKYYDYKYDASNARIEYPLDPAFIAKEMIYKIEIVRLSKDGSYVVTKTSVGIDISDQANGITLGGVMGKPSNNIKPSSSSEGSVSPVNISLLEMFFRVSKYERFENKIDASTVVNNEKVINGEGFDDYEVNQGLVDITVDENNSWLKSYFTLMYNHNFPAKIYPEEACIFIHPAVVNLEGGASAYDNVLNSIGLTTTTAPKINASIFSNGIVTSSQIGIIENKLSHFVEKSYNKVKSDISKSLPSCYNAEEKIYYPVTTFTPTWIYDIYTTPFIPLAPNTLKANIMYNIPSVGVTTTKKLTF